MATLHLLIVSTEHGDSPSLHATEEDARNAAYEYAAEYWDQDGPGRHDVPIPEDRDQAVEDYFEDCTDETYSIIDIPVPDPEPTPPRLPPIVYADEAVDSWIEHVNACHGWNAQLSLDDGGEREVVLCGAANAGEGGGLGVEVQYWIDNKEPTPDAPVCFVPAVDIANIRIY